MKFGIYTLQIENHLRRLMRETYSDFGWGNGYVLLPHNHPLYDVHYDDISVNVHGGLTFSERFDSENFLEWIKDLDFHGDVTLENYQKFEGYWMIGFDTAHYGDDLISCSEHYVVNETEDLLEQCLSDGIDGMKKYKQLYLRNDKLCILDLLEKNFKN